MTDTVKIVDFTASNRISMTAERVDSNPHFMDSDNMDHWKCVFTRKVMPEERPNMTTNGRAALQPKTVAKMTTYFSMGYGHNGTEPDAASVLDCLASDASSVDQNTFETWAGDMGYDSDSRKAEKIYKACEHGARRLKKFLGEDMYETLLYNTEWK